MEHVPVLLEEVITVMDPQPGGRYIDATVGDGGHTQALLEHSQTDGQVLGLDQDAAQLTIAKKQLASYGGRVTLVQSRFSGLYKVATSKGFEQVDGILFDLGISSRQLNDPVYGLTFDDNATLDMRLSSDLNQTAADFLNRANEREIADVLYLYGDRHNSRSLARKITEYRRKRQFVEAQDLKEALGLWQPKLLAPIFQALRIYINKEYEELITVLPQAISLLKSGGVLAIITFHSGEDRIVKRFLRDCEEVAMAKKIIRPTIKELRQNSRSRSAILRYAVKQNTNYI